MPIPYRYVNQRGSAAVASNGVRVTDDAVVFTFANHAFAGAWYYGTVFVNLRQAIPTGTTGTLPVLFETNGVTQAVTTLGGAAVTAADIVGTGVYQFWYERDANVLQIMTGAV